MGSASDVTLMPWCWLMTDGLANNTWKRSMSRATSLGPINMTGASTPGAATPNCPAAVVGTEIHGRDDTAGLIQRHRYATAGDVLEPSRLCP